MLHVEFMEMMKVFNAEGELLDLAFHEGKPGGPDRGDRLVVLGHGVTAHKDRPLLTSLAGYLAERGWPCVRFSFSGNGASEGRFEESTLSKEVGDLTAVVDQLGVGKKVAYVGHSMGAAVGALTAARDERLRVMVSLAGMVYTREFGEREFGDVVAGEGVMWEDPEFPLSEAFVQDLEWVGDVLPAVKELRLPWLLLHGLADDVVFPRDSRDLSARLRGPNELVEIEGADHLFSGYEEAVCGEVARWLESHF